MPIHVSSNVLIIRRSKLLYIASGIITPIGVMIQILCIKLVKYWDKYTEMHGQQNVKIKIKEQRLSTNTLKFCGSNVVVSCWEIGWNFCQCQDYMLISLANHISFEGCPESFQPFWTSRGQVAWPWCNLAYNQNRPYCGYIHHSCPLSPLPTFTFLVSPSSSLVLTLWTT